MASEPPLGVKVLSLLAGIGGGLMVLSGVLVAVLPGLMGEAIGLLLPVGGLFSIIGVLYVAYAMGLWELETWAWWVAVILGVFTFTTNLGSALRYGYSALLVIWNGAVVYYLYENRKLFNIKESL